MLSERPWKLEAVMGLLAGWMLAMVVGLLISQAFMRLIPGNPIAGNLFLQFVISTFFLHGVGLIMVQVFLAHHGVGWGEFLGWRKLRLKSFGQVILLTLIVLPVVLGLNSLSGILLTKVHVAPVEQESMKVLQISITLGQRIVFGLGAILLAPLVEESIFRGILYPALKDLGRPRVAVLASSMLFALIHFNLMTFVPLFLLALGLVWLLEMTETLIAPIIAHACFNGANFALYLNQAEITRWWNELIHPLAH
jgi:membrane protease YdiL (CAAX protease family)